MPAQLYVVNKFKLNVIVEGSGSPIVLLHGFPDSSKLWEPQITHLVKQGYKVIAPDLLGYGMSDKPQEAAEYSLKRLQQLVLGLLDQLGISKAAVVGHDWGAALAWRLAISAPQRVSRLVVLSVGHPGAGCAAGGPRQRSRWWYMLFFQYVGTAEACLQAHDWQLLREVLGGEREEVVQDYIQQLSQPGALTAALNWYRANFHPQVFGATQLQPYPLIRCPVLGLWSAGDKALLEEQMAASQLYVEPGCWSYARVQGAGHWIPRDAPEELNTLLLRFLKQEEGCGGGPAGAAGGGGGDGVVMPGVNQGAGVAGSAAGGEARAVRAESRCTEGCGTPQKGAWDGEAVVMASRAGLRSRL